MSSDGVLDTRFQSDVTWIGKETRSLEPGDDLDHSSCVGLSLSQFIFKFFLRADFDQSLRELFTY